MTKRSLCLAAAGCPIRAAYVHDLLSIMSTTTSRDQSVPGSEACADARFPRVGEHFDANPPARVQVLIQDRESLLFHMSPNGWTTDAGAAEDFRTVVKAIDFAVRNRMRGLYVVMRFENPEFDLQLPVNF